MTPNPIYAPHVAQLARLLAEPDPLLVIPEPDDGWTEALLAAIHATSGADAGMCASVEAIDAAGRWERGIAGRFTPTGGQTTLDDFLTQHIGAVKTGSGLLWIRGSGADIAATGVLAAMKAVAATIRRYRTGWRILVTGAEATLPPAMAHAGRLVALDRPRRGVGVPADCPMRGFVGTVVRASGADADPDLVEFAVQRLQGLEASSIRRILDRALHRSRLDHDIRACIREERDALLRAGVLEVREFDPATKLAEMGGLHVLRRFLEDVGLLFSDWVLQDEQSAHLGHLLPRGVLLVGLPGCGKSLAAEVAAAQLGAPLLQLHMGRLMGRFLGESEANLEQALASARAAAPCVLWIDEIEKAVGGLGVEGGSGTGGRMLGMLLGWMQDNNSGVFVVGTANSLDQVPPELLRRGRFDEHFRVGLPNEAEREEILRGAIEAVDTESEKQQREVLAATMAKKTGDFSGADLKAFVNEAARRAWLADWRRLLRAEDFPKVGEEFRPQAHQFKEQYARLKEKTEKLGFRDASTSDGKPLRPRSRTARPSSPLPPVLARIAFGRAPVAIEWSAAGFGHRLVVSTTDSRRVAALNVGSTAMATYRVSRGTLGGKVPAVVFSRNSPSTSGPEAIALVSAGQDALEVVIVELGAQTRLSVKIGATPGTSAEPSNHSPREVGSHHVILRDAGGHRLAVTRIVRAATGLSLEEAVRLVDSAPRSVVIEVSRDAALALVQELHDVGAKAANVVLPRPPAACPYCGQPMRHNLSVMGSRWQCRACGRVL